MPQAQQVTCKWGGGRLRGGGRDDANVREASGLDGALRPLAEMPWNSESQTVSHQPGLCSQHSLPRLSAFWNPRPARVLGLWVPLLFSDALPKEKGPTLYLQGYQEDGKEGRRRGQMEGSPVPQGEGQTTQDHLACAVGASQDRHGDRPPAGRGPLHH